MMPSLRYVNFIQNWTRITQIGRPLLNIVDVEKLSIQNWRRNSAAFSWDKSRTQRAQWKFEVFFNISCVDIFDTFFNILYTYMFPTLFNASCWKIESILSRYPLDLYKFTTTSKAPSSDFLCAQLSVACHEFDASFQSTIFHINRFHDDDFSLAQTRVSETEPAKNECPLTAAFVASVADFRRHPCATQSLARNLARFPDWILSS